MATPEQMRSRYRGIVGRVRNIPGKHGLREHSVAVRIATSAGTYTGDGVTAGDWTAITEMGGHAPKVRWVNDEDVALGALPRGGVIVGPITPSNGTLGTLLATLSGSAAVTGELFHVRITGPNHPDGAVYTGHDVKVERALHYVLRATPSMSAEPP